MRIEDYEVLKQCGPFYRIEGLLVLNKLDGGMIHAFLHDCFAGEYLRRTGQADGYVNRLSDFYIDARVGFTGHRAKSKLLDEAQVWFDLYVPCMHDWGKFDQGEHTLWKSKAGEYYKRPGRGFRRVAFCKRCHGEILEDK